MSWENTRTNNLKTCHQPPPPSLCRGLLSLGYIFTALFMLPKWNCHYVSAFSIMHMTAVRTSYWHDHISGRTLLVSSLLSLTGYMMLLKYAVRNRVVRTSKLWMLWCSSKQLTDLALVWLLLGKVCLWCSLRSSFFSSCKLVVCTTHLCVHQACVSHAFPSFTSLWEHPLHTIPVPLKLLIYRGSTKLRKRRHASNKTYAYTRPSVRNNYLHAIEHDSRSRERGTQ